jgi:hypothetical protein
MRYAVQSHYVPCFRRPCRASTGVFRNKPQAATSSLFPGALPGRAVIRGLKPSSEADNSRTPYMKPMHWEKAPVFHIDPLSWLPHHKMHITSCPRQPGAHALKPSRTRTGSGNHRLSRRRAWMKARRLRRAPAYRGPSGHAEPERRTRLARQALPQLQTRRLTIFPRHAAGAG